MINKEPRTREYGSSVVGAGKLSLLGLGVG